MPIYKATANGQVAMSAQEESDFLAERNDVNMLKKQRRNDIKRKLRMQLDTATLDGAKIASFRDDLQDGAWIITQGIATTYAILADDTPVILNASKIQAVLNYRVACSENAKTHWIAMNALSDADAIRNYDISTGWPSTSL